MLPVIENKTITVTPKARYLTPTELVAFRSETQPKGKPTENTSEAKSLESLYGELRKCISVPRIERFYGRTVAFWDNNISMAKVKYKKGKFETFGKMIGKQLCLEYYETMYLLEIGRLYLEYNFSIMSIEQAYLALLGEGSSLKYNLYLVYSYLTRAGYILTKHKNSDLSAEKNITDNDCIWAWVANTVQNKPIPPFIRKTELFAKVKRNIESIKASIIEQRQVIDTLSNEEPELEAPAAKRRKLMCDALPKCAKSFLDFLKDEPEYKKFSAMFKKFEVINSKISESPNSLSDEIDVDLNETKEKLCLHFDLYLHNNEFKKSHPDPPLMRVLVLSSSQTFPCHSEISALHSRLLSQTPILVVSVGDAKQIQAFLYFFT